MPWVLFCCCQAWMEAGDRKPLTVVTLNRGILTLIISIHDLEATNIHLLYDGPMSVDTVVEWRNHFRRVPSSIPLERGFKFLSFILNTRWQQNYIKHRTFVQVFIRSYISLGMIELMGSPILPGGNTLHERLLRHNSLTPISYLQNQSDHLSNYNLIEMKIKLSVTFN